MPSKPQPRQHSASRTVKEKALSPRAGLHFRDRVKSDVPIRPPRADGSHHQEQAGKSANKKGELVKNMTSLPGFLQRAENPQDKILNFGVLDWESLEKWKRAQKRSPGHSRAGASFGGSSSSKVSSIASGTSKTEVMPSQNQASCSEVYFPEFLPHSSKARSGHDFTTIEKCGLDEQRRQIRKDKSYVRGTLKDKSHKTKARDSYQGDCLEMGMSSWKLSMHEKTVDKCSELQSDLAHQHHHKRQDSVILLLPKDFSRSGCLDEFQCTSANGNSAEVNWSSFSDVFSIEELHFEESTSDVPHSCPLPFMAGTETELDTNLDRLSHDQRMNLPSDQPKLPSHLNRKLSVSVDVHREGNNKEDLTSSTTSKGLHRKGSHLSNSDARGPSLARQFSSSIGRLSRSLSFREGSTLPQLKHASIRSGPAQALSIHDNITKNTVSATGRGRISPFRKLLDPILKSKAAKPINLVDSSLSYMENLKSISIKGMNDGPATQSEKSGSTLIKAVLQLTVKSGMPSFKFLVETNNELLVSTVKRLNPLTKDDPSWLYSFYSVQEVKRKGGGWRYKGNKGKSTDFSYKFIGQMKVSEPVPCGNEDNLEEKFTRESVLYGIDLRKVGKESSESAVKRELGAIVVKMPKEVSGDDQRKNYENKSTEIIIAGSIVVILPSALHSLPSEGVPASLINRWRTGGLCDCGGWDVGCKLQVLTNQDQDDKLLRSSSTSDPLQHHCNLFLQGDGKENWPVFRLQANGDGIYWVEYDSAISSLQAFAISVAVLSNQKQPSFSAANCYRRGRKGHYRSKSCIVHGEGTRYATYPPHSPVSRA